jgi:hypothetical protein
VDHTAGNNELGKIYLKNRMLGSAELRKQNTVADYHSTKISKHHAAKHGTKRATSFH